MLLDKVIIAVISPLGTALCLLLVALLLRVFGRKALSAVAVLASFLWLLVFSLPVVGTGLFRHLEAEYPAVAAADLPRADAVVVLGGGMSGSGMPQQPVNMGSAADRVWFAAQLYHGGRAPVVLASGGAAPGAMPESTAMAMVLADFGVPAAAIVEEAGSRNTRGNAAFSGALLRDMGAKKILLVTSAFHMARAAQHFAAEGFEVVPAPTDYESSLDRFPYPWLPDSGALDMSARALKERIAILWFKLQGAG